MDERYAIKKSTLDELAAKVRILRDIPSPITPERMIEEIEAGAAELNAANDNLNNVIESKGNIYAPTARIIPEYKFRGSTALTGVDFPEVTSVGAYAFNGCTALENVNIPKLKEIGNAAFNTCTSLKSVSFPKATSDGTYLFYGCTALESVYIPMLKGVGVQAFANCDKLREVDLEQAKAIGANAFTSCDALDTLILRGLTVVDLSSTSVFLGTPIREKTGFVYVPFSLVASYEEHPYWNAYNIRAIEDYPDIMGYRWEKFGPKLEYVLTWDGATVTETTSQYATVEVYPGYNFDKQTGELTTVGTPYYAAIADLTTGNYRLVGGEVQSFASLQASGGQYRIVWRKPRISEISIPGTEVSYGYVTSRDPNRYPDNGGAEDGYRYIKVTGGAE